MLGHGVLRRTCLPESDNCGNGVLLTAQAIAQASARRSVPADQNTSLEDHCDK
jgi:hypothetical protein